MFLAYGKLFCLIFFKILTDLFVAVFVPGYDVLWSYESLLGLYQCDKKFKEHVIVHLVYPLSHPPTDNKLERALKQALSGNRICHEFIDRLRKSHLNKQNYAIEKVRTSFTQGQYLFFSYLRFTVVYVSNILFKFSVSYFPVSASRLNFCEVAV